MSEVTFTHYLSDRLSEDDINWIKDYLCTKIAYNIEIQGIKFNMMMNHHEMTTDVRHRSTATIYFDDNKEYTIYQMLDNEQKKLIIKEFRNAMFKCDVDESYDHVEHLHSFYIQFMPTCNTQNQVYNDDGFNSMDWTKGLHVTMAILILKEMKQKKS